jgi:hypothetical protein
MTKGTVTPLVTLIAVGTEQVADTGAPAQVKATLPSKPEVSCRLNVAVCPAVTEPRHTHIVKFARRRKPR